MHSRAGREGRSCEGKLGKAGETEKHRQENTWPQKKADSSNDFSASRSDSLWGLAVLPLLNLTRSCCIINTFLLSYPEWVSVSCNRMSHKAEQSHIIFLEILHV